MRSSDVALLVSLAVGLTLAPSRALATPAFPGVIQSHLSLGASPPCTLCHQGATQRGTVTTPFGRTLRARGLVAYDEASLRLALDAIEAEGKDSDGDGVSDARELRDGADPNEGAGATGDAVAEYGCASSRVRAAGSFQMFLVSMVVLLLRARRRRKCLGGRIARTRS